MKRVEIMINKNREKDKSNLFNKRNKKGIIYILLIISVNIYSYYLYNLASLIPRYRILKKLKDSQEIRQFSYSTGISRIDLHFLDVPVYLTVFILIQMIYILGSIYLLYEKEDKTTLITTNLLISVVMGIFVNLLLNSEKNKVSSIEKIFESFGYLLN